MIINIGTANKSKIQTIQELDGYYDWFKINELNPIKVSSGVNEQPLTIEETLTGARNRAFAAYSHSKCDLGIGMESGLMKLEGSLTGYVACECSAVYDGERYYIGTGGGFEYPKIAIDRVMEYGEDLSEAYRNGGLTDEEKIGENDGAIGQLTVGRINRKDYQKRVVEYALTSLHNKNLYI
ncbi:MAG: inosine/xanthosine triphosphatase [Candidatus Gracilibacteria bacterium]|nr:inosine/xanthosine triphosphatase [Candidatus Gracilibacteria bacterium]